MTRILSVFNLLKRVGFAVLLLVSMSFGQVTVRWMTEFAPTTFVSPYDVVLTPEAVVVVGGLRNWGSQTMDAFIQVIDRENGSASPTIRHSQGSFRLYRDAVALAGENVAICGQLSSIGFVIRSDTQGEIAWSYTTPAGFADEATSIVSLNDGSLVISSPWLDVTTVGTELLLTQVDSSGSELNSSLSSFVYGQRINIHDATALTDTELVFVGSIERDREPLLDQSMYILATSVSGDSLWSRTITQQDTDLVGGSVAVTETGEIVVGAIADPWSLTVELFKFNQWGDEVWRRLLDLGYPGPTSVEVECHGNDIYVASTYFDFDVYSIYIAKFDSSGMVAWDTVLAQESAFLNTTGFTLSKDGQTAYVVAGGEPTGEFHVVRGYVMCLDLNGTGWTPSPFPQTIEIASLYPNPTNSSVSLVFKLLSQGNVTGFITDVLGRRVQSLEFGYFPVGEYVQNLSLNRVTSGQYVITIRSGNQSDNRSFIVVR